MTSARRAGSNPRRPQPGVGAPAARKSDQRARPRVPRSPGRRTYAGPPGRQGCGFGGRQVRRGRAGGRSPQHPAGVRPDPRALPRTRNAARPPPWPAVAAVAPRLPRHAGAQPGAQPRGRATAYQRRCAPHLPRSLRRLQRRSACSSRWPAAHGQGRSGRVRSGPAAGHRDSRDTAPPAHPVRSLRALAAVHAGSRWPPGWSSHPRPSEGRMRRRRGGGQLMRGGPGGSMISLQRGKGHRPAPCGCGRAGARARRKEKTGGMLVTRKRTAQVRPHCGCPW